MSHRKHVLSEMVEIQLFESNQDSNSYTVLYLTTSLSTAKVSSSSGWMPLRGCSSILHISAREGRLHLHIRLEGSLENDHFLEANYFTMVLLSNYYKHYQSYLTNLLFIECT